VVATVRPGAPQHPPPTARAPIPDRAALDRASASGRGCLSGPTLESLRDATPASSEGAPASRSLDGPTDGRVGTVDFVCAVCGRHYGQDLGSCPRDGDALHAERISMPFLWWG
jgi:hypothetical protein